jgi:hypothetical protein
MSCICHVAGEFPILGSLGIISANLRTNVDVVVTEGGLVLYGPAFGDLSISAYAPLSDNERNSLGCPARAGASFNWDRRYACDDTGGNIAVYFIPRGKIRSYKEGEVTGNITMTEIVRYPFFSASAGSGPATPYLIEDHVDAYNFSYSGGPIPISPSDATHEKSLSIFGGILPTGSRLYLQSFSWEYTPPNVPNVSYSFLFSYSENTP